MFLYSSSPKSPIPLAFSIQGFQTTRLNASRRQINANTRVIWKLTGILQIWLFDLDGRSITNLKENLVLNLFIDSINLSTDGDLVILFCELFGILDLVNVFTRSQALDSSFCRILVCRIVSSVVTFLYGLLTGTLKYVWRSKLNSKVSSSSFFKWMNVLMDLAVKLTV